MNIVALIKQVPDTGLSLQIKESQIEESQLKWVISPYDEFALEAALQLKAQLQAQVTVMTLGPERAKSALLTALALGADTAYHLLTNTMPQDPLSVAESLKTKIKELTDVSLILTGKLSTDSNNFALPQMLAQLLDFPFVSNVNKLEYKNSVFTLNRECGAGVEELLQAKLPLILSVDKGFKHASLPFSSWNYESEKKAPSYRKNRSQRKYFIKKPQPAS